MKHGKNLHKVLIKKTQPVTSITLNFRASDNRPKSFQVSLRAYVLCVNIKAILLFVFNLRISDIQNEDLYGYIPYQIGELSQLTELRINDNNLENFIPPTLFKLTNLKGLYLHHNSFKGSIPKELGNLKLLQNFTCDFEQLVEMDLTIFNTMKLKRFSHSLPVDSLKFASQCLNTPHPIKDLPMFIYKLSDHSFRDIAYKIQSNENLSFIDLIQPQFISNKPTLSDASIEIGGRVWKTHHWIWNLRLVQIEMLTDETVQLLKSVSPLCGQLLILWIYTDEISMDGFKGLVGAVSKEEACVAYAELAFIFNHLKKDNHLVNNALYIMYDWLLRVRSADVLYVLKHLFRFPMRLMHQMLYKRTRNDYSNNLDSIEALEFLISDLLDINFQGDPYNLRSVYIDPEDSELEARLDPSKTLLEDMKRYTRVKEYCKILFEFDDGESLVTYEPSILWSQCIPLRSYIVENQSKISMSSLNLISNISQSTWHKMMDYFHCHELDMQGIKEDVFAMYEFFILRHQIQKNRTEEGRDAADIEKQQGVECRKEGTIHQENEPRDRLDLAFLEYLMVSYLDIELCLDNFVLILESLFARDPVPQFSEYKDIKKMLSQKPFIVSACNMIKDDQLFKLKCSEKVKTLIKHINEESRRSSQQGH